MEGWLSPRTGIDPVNGKIDFPVTPRPLLFCV